jgi:heme-degrading monooxygenase HmoA
VTFAAVFGYEVDAADAEAFERVYGPDGEWARFFRGGDGYVGTDLWCDAGDEQRPRYLVVDRWRSAEEYAAFREANEQEYRRRGRETEALYRSETVLGRFESR